MGNGYGETLYHALYGYSPLDERFYTMRLPNTLKISLLVAGDILALYAGLFLTLIIRYGLNFNEQFFDWHLIPFSLIFPVWLLIFYIAGLYDLRRLRNNVEFLQTLSLTIFLSALVTISLFYLIPSFGITPKTNLFVFIACFAVIESWWRRTFNIRASFREGLHRVLLLDMGTLAKELHALLKDEPQMGYSVQAWFDGSATPPRLRELIEEHRINLVVVSPHLRHDPETSRMLYELLASGIEVQDVPALYESVFRKVPLSGVTESWFIEHAIGIHRFYDDLKRGLEVIGALTLGTVLSPLLILIAFLVRTTSRGPVLIRQLRLGRHGEPFVLYKFRSMLALAPDGSAETNGAVWSSIADVRTTPIGKFLRASHLDELPQLWNVIRGDLSFVGPRPERPEIVKKLIPEIPYYEIRLIVKPGITGWAQISYKKDATLADVSEKLAYDVYYLKNRSLVLDLAIIIKTIKSFFVNHA